MSFVNKTWLIGNYIEWRKLVLCRLSESVLFLQGYTERKNNDPDYHEYYSREHRESHAGGHAPD